MESYERSKLLADTAVDGTLDLNDPKVESTLQFQHLSGTTKKQRQRRLVLGPELGRVYGSLEPVDETEKDPEAQF
ncbi:hypothetical protein CERZMDRAFT_95898 [Cercospora zeae-maydis SCOH1-5]|uniref:Uncharacterized protein n=1 Tax=Cercospora zeae-maydis SCOH1-5 TaxID=717836 RepID=A0A6A6FKW9_9PEZI|nr:hypothetical protein CERZMDRAFT_95898 [Cercospora zeae-maydis SCOH1-5]